MESTTRLSLFIRLKENPDDKMARDRFCEMYQPLVRRYLARRNLQEADLDNLSQDVMMKVLRHLPVFEYDPSKSFRSWLRQVVFHEFCAWWRSQPRDQGSGDSKVAGMLEQFPDEEAWWEREYERQHVRWAVSKVKEEFDERTFESFWLSDMEEKTLDEVGKQLAISLAAAFRNRNRVRQRIRAVLEEVGCEGTNPEGQR